MRDEDATTVAFVCMQNAGQSQMAYVFARREREACGLEDEVALVTGGTCPAEEIHSEVVEAMGDIGIDHSGRTPREVTVEDLQQSDLVITMGCSADDVCPAEWGGETRNWNTQ